MTHEHPQHGHGGPQSPAEAWKDESLVSAFVEQTTAHADQRGLSPSAMDAML